MRCAFIYNPNSGKGYIINKIDTVVNRLKERYDEVVLMPTQYACHAKKIVHDICEQNQKKDENYIDTIVAAGGDGTVNEVISGLAPFDVEIRPYLGLIPCGTVNDLASSLKIPKKINKQLDVIINGKSIEYDFFKINNDKYGVYVCCTGLFTQQSYSTNQKKKRFWGRVAYAIDAIKSLKKQRPVDLIFKTGETTIEEKCSLMLAINSRSVAGMKLNKQADINDGKVDVVMLPCSNKIRIRDYLRVAKLFVLGVKWAKRKYERKKNVQYFNVANFNLQVNQTLNVDGEKLEETNINFEVVEKGLHIFVK